MAVGMLLDMAADAYGDRVALGPAAHGMSYAEVRRAACAGATLIAERGARSVVFVGVNGPVHPVLLFAAGYAGVPYVPLNYRLNPSALADLIAELDDPFVVCDDQYLGVLRGASPALQGSADWLAVAQAAKVPAPPVDVADDATAVVLFTSGTTSAPKGVVLSHANLVSYVLQTVEFGAADPSDAALVSVPPYHIAGTGTILTNVFSGRRMVYLPDFSARAWLDLVRVEKVTTAMLVPTMLARIVEELGEKPAETPRLRTMSYGGARMPRPILEAALRSFNHVDFVNAYGLTETSSTIAILGPGDHRDALNAADPAVALRLGSVGTLVSGVEGQIRDQLGGICDPGEVGELWVRGPQVSGRYLKIGSVLGADGWFPTHDRAWFDTEGYLFVEGRADDTIIRGGENIAPAEIEDVLREHHGVADAAVFGRPDNEWGERIVGVVVSTESAVDAEDLRAFVRARLRGSRTPDDIVFVAELPYTATGKLLRNKLRVEAHGKEQ